MLIAGSLSHTGVSYLDVHVSDKHVDDCEIIIKKQTKNIAPTDNDTIYKPLCRWAAETTNTSVLVLQVCTVQVLTGLTEYHPVVYSL